MQKRVRTRSSSSSEFIHDDDKSWSTESEEREESEDNSDKTVMFDEDNGTLPPTQPSVDTSLSLQTSTASGISNDNNCRS
jgi:hypothetical protein